MYIYTYTCVSVYMSMGVCVSIQILTFLRKFDEKYLVYHTDLRSFDQLVTKILYIVMHTGKY